jgi:hypothetical protein
MIELSNAELRVDLLDPVADASRLGPRFCWGGYIWQVHDNIVGPLLSGPEWPSPTPSAFNGQGLPESFRHRTLDGHPLTWRGDRGVALGAGEISAAHDGQSRVIVPCTWEMTRRSETIEFSTTHTAAGFSYSLSRRIEIAGRAVRSLTRLTNLAREPLVLEWFAHPFFMLVDGTVRAEIRPDAALPENPGFELTAGRITQKRRFTSVSDGHMDRGLRLASGVPLRATFAHPTLTDVIFETSFAPDACVIWGNDRTFSFEPYLSLNLGSGETREWVLRYGFGPSSGISAPSPTSRNTSF